MDEVELGLNLVAAQVVDRGAILIQNQVLCVRPEPLHPLLVPAVDEYRFWGYVDHQRHRCISLSLVPGQKEE